MGKTVKVLVVDDSAFMRHVISKMLSADPELDVVGTARDGVDALAQIARFEPDVVTMDIEMPRMDGLTTLSKVMEEHPVPVVVVSSYTSEGAEMTVNALERGAVDFVCKPSGSVSVDMHSVGDELLRKVKGAARAFVRRACHDGFRRNAAAGMAAAPTPIKGPLRKIVVIGSSTGGPRALHEVVPRLSPDLPAAFVIVQHMPAGFTKSLAASLGRDSTLTVKEAQEGDRVGQGIALIAPGNYHMVVDADGRVRLNQEPTRHGVRPSADVTMEAVAQVAGRNAIGVVLTGMGRDGEDGARAIKKARGRIIAEHASTCVVYGMPRSVIEAGCADKIVPIHYVADEISRMVTGS